jgi:uncharacterized protein
VRIAFADTGYWLGLINPDDNLHRRAQECATRLIGWRLVTTDWVLIELLNAVSRRGANLRYAAMEAVHNIIGAPDVEVVRITEAGFARALTLYEARSDKAWSLTDCASIDLMQVRRIEDAVAHDRHFEQAGFRALLR